ncbi:MAG: molybdopterin-dependent oxidoreductase, partial [Anaerolineaceae bacterium]|nr:molybdopterin-dependent oxidoreductase [Anaerolineaceae bacterium]
MKILLPLLLGLICFGACGPSTQSTVTESPILAKTAVNSPLPTAQEGSSPVHCDLPPVIAPTKPAVIPGYTGLDETTGLHMTGVVQDINLADYHLKVSGKVNYPLELTYAELRCMPKITAEPTLICKGVFEDVAQWSGVPLDYVLGLAGIQPDAK